MVSPLDPAVESTHHEFAYGAQDVTTSTQEAATADVRTFWDKVLFRKTVGGELQWETAGTEFRFSGGAGHTGSGTLRTKAIAIPRGTEPDNRHGEFRGCYFHMLERRVAATGTEVLVARLRESADEGAKDVATQEFVIHASADAGDESWHGFYVDLTQFIAPHAARGVHLVLELRVTCETVTKDPKGCLYAFQRPSLSIVTSMPKSQPRAPLFLK